MKYFASLVIVFLISCSSRTTYKDPDAAGGEKGWGPFEVKQTTKVMVEEMYHFLRAKEEPIFIAFKPIRNRTSEHIETEMLANQIRESLIEKKVYFVQMNYRGEIIQEIVLGQSGLIDDSALPIGNLKSPNYFLEGVITDTVNYSNNRSVQYIVVSLNLTRARSGVMEWTRNKEFLKSTKEKKVGW